MAATPPSGDAGDDGRASEGHSVEATEPGSQSPTIAPWNDVRQVVLAAAPAADEPCRERADVADLIKHMRSRQLPPPAEGSLPSEGTAALASPLLQPLARPPAAVPPADLEARVRVSRSFCDAEHRRQTAPEVTELRRQLCTPGGFRRGHLHARASADGLPEDQRPARWSKSLVESLAQSASLYEQLFGLPQFHEDGSVIGLEHRGSFVGGLGNWGVAAAIFKANIGTNILFVPHAFSEGGWVMAFSVLVALAALSVVCVSRLIESKTVGRESFGDIMERATGTTGRSVVNLCIVLFQCGTCACYFVNVANMTHESFLPHVDARILMMCEAVVVAPMVLIRNVAKLSSINIFGGLMTIIGVVVTLLAIGSELGDHGPAPVDALRPRGFLVSLGICCYTFEGIGLAIPVFESARYPDTYMRVYSMTISGIVGLISLMAFIGYYTYGEATDTLVLINLKSGAVGSVVRVMFSLVMLASFPLQMLPAIRIVESVFLRPSRPGTCDKHFKSGFRVAFVVLVAVISIGAATSLDNFVSLIGVVCGLPLAFIFPAICHRKLVAERGSLSSLSDVAFVVFGTVIALVVGVHDVVNWGH